MKDTSGAAYRSSLRGEGREATLVARRRKQPCPAGSEKRTSNDVPQRRLSRPSSRRTGDRRCPSRMGWGSALAASDRGEGCEQRLQLVPVPSKLGWLRSDKDTSHPPDSHRPRKGRSEGSAVVGDHDWGERGSGRTRARARGSYRLQKPAEGAWLPCLRGEKPGQEGLVSRARATGLEHAPEAHSLGGKAGRKGLGLTNHTETWLRSNICRGKALRAWRTASFDGLAGGRVLVFRDLSFGTGIGRQKEAPEASPPLHTRSITPR